jgi:hypothetical protein
MSVSMSNWSGHTVQSDSKDSRMIPKTSNMTVDIADTAEWNTGHSQIYDDVHSDENIHIFYLPWEQVLCKYVLTYLSIVDLFKLRAVSCASKDLVQTYFRLQFHLNTSSLGDHFTSQAFQLMTRECTNLKSVSVKGAKSWLTTEAMVNVISANPRLERIDLTGCLTLSGATLHSLGVNCSNLKHLCLKDCVWLSVDNFISFLCNHPDLEYLDLSGCWNLGDDLVIQLVQISPSIKHLLLGNLYGLTDRSVVAIAHCCPNLAHLSIKGCWRVTDSSIKLLSQYCPKLNVIQVQECRDVTEDSLGYLRQRGALIDKAAPPGYNLYRLEQQAGNVHRLNLVL